MFLSGVSIGVRINNQVDLINAKQYSCGTSFNLEGCVFHRLFDYFTQ